LRENAAGRRVGRVEAVFERESQTLGTSLFAGFRHGETGEVGDLDLAAVDGESHRDEGGEKRDDEHGERAEKDVEEAIDAADLQLHKSGSGYRVMSARGFWFLGAANFHG
jgi:hypothetical protein